MIQKQCASVGSRVAKVLGEDASATDDQLKGEMCVMALMRTNHYHQQISAISVCVNSIVRIFSPRLAIDREEGRSICGDLGISLSAFVY